MGEAQPRHPGSQRLMRHWPVSVNIFEDESISSWLIRGALENGCDPLVLTGAVWPDWRAWTTDIDRGLPEERLTSISAVSGVEALTIQRASLSREVRLLCPEGLQKNGIWPWVQALGARNRRYRGGLQYCPACLTNDQKPYLRRHWRFSWNTGCLQHRVRLIDQCTQCSKPIEPHCLEAIRAVQLSVCASCGFDLREASTEVALPDARRFQLRVVSILNSAGGEIAGRSATNDEWFEACRHLIGIIRRGVNSRDSVVGRALNDIGVDVLAIAPENLSLQLELLPVIVRENLLACLEQLLGRLEHFVVRLKRQGASVNSIWGRSRYVPPALRTLVEQLELVDKSPVRRRRKIPGKPKSPTTVLKAWTRLKRKHGIE